MGNEGLVESGLEVRETPRSRSERIKEADREVSQRISELAGEADKRIKEDPTYRR